MRIACRSFILFCGRVDGGYSREECFLEDSGRQKSSDFTSTFKEVFLKEALVGLAALNLVKYQKLLF